MDYDVEEILIVGKKGKLRGNNLMIAQDMSGR